MCGGGRWAAGGMRLWRQGLCAGRGLGGSRLQHPQMGGWRGREGAGAHREVKVEAPGRRARRAIADGHDAPVRSPAAGVGRRERAPVGHVREPPAHASVLIVARPAAAREGSAALDWCALMQPVAGAAGVLRASVKFWGAHHVPCV